MKKASVVIGAGYGDEGKGVVTSTLANNNDLVVRFCGGSQAAHTVEYGKTRHVFHHFGSGTLQGKPTYLAKHFILNPIMFMEEYDVLKEKGFNSKVFIHSQCKITTPFDMIINQALESKRGNDRHGSCGLGINETVTRHEIKRFDFSIYNAAKNMNHVKDMLMCMFDVYYKERADKLELDVKIFKNADMINKILDQYIIDLSDMLSNAVLVDDDILIEYDNVLFEGSQGLLLDEVYGEFPHVTRARTGLKNVISITDEYLKNDVPDVYYVTRHYMTRHGAGPFKNEFKTHGEIIDKTNIHNTWQGSMRFGFLDINDLENIVNKDRENRFRNTLVVTCMDQKFKLVNKNHKIFINENGIIQSLQKKKFLRMLGECVNMRVRYTDSSQTRSKLKK